MADDHPDILAIFTECLVRDSDKERSRYLDEVCQGDRQARGRVEELLRAHSDAGNFLGKRPPAGAPILDAAPITEKPGTTIGRYKLQEQIGEGGFGVVFMAEQQEPVRRRVALKIIKPGMDTKEVIGRFEAERQALALMDHPNIAKVLDAGATESGRPYFVMELVKGVPITEYCDTCNLPNRERLELFVEASQAVQHAHQKGIIHRDIKPSNVLIAIQDGRPQSKVIDFGVAKATNQRLTEQTVLTGFAQMVGTPLYMSPEQAEMTALDVDTRTDVYSLGVLLYELITGTTPFERQRLKEASYDELRRIIREEEPAKPSHRISTLQQAASTIAEHRRTDPKRLRQSVRGDLDWITMRALEKDRTRRYETINAFAADVRRYLNDEPVTACPPSAAYRFRKFARRNKALLTTTVLVAAVLVTGVVVSASQAFRAAGAERRANSYLMDERAARQEAESFRRIAEAEAKHARKEAERAQEAADGEARAKDQIRRQLYLSDMNVAFQAWQEADVKYLLELLDRHRPKPGEEDLRGFEWYNLWSLCHRERLTLYGHAGWLNSVAFSPDGKTLAAGGKSEAAILWDPQAGQEVLRLNGPADIHALAFSPDGATLATAGWDGTIRLWDLSSGTVLFNLPGDPQSRQRANGALAFSPDGRLLAVAEHQQAVRVWDLHTKQPRYTLEGHTQPVVALAFSPDGKIIATATFDPNQLTGEPAEVKVWDAGTGQEQCSLPNESHGVYDLEIDPQGHTLALANLDKTITLWDLSTRQLRATLRGHTLQVDAVAFAPDGQTLASGSWDTTVRLWDLATGQELATLIGHQAGIDNVAFAPDGNSVASVGGPDRMVKLWDVTSHRRWTAVEGHRTGVVSVAFLREGRVLVTGGRDGSVQQSDAATGAERATLPAHAEPVDAMAFSPDGATVASATPDGTIVLRGTATGREQVSLGTNEGPISALALSPDGKTIAAAGADKKIRLWDAKTGRMLRSFPAHEKGIWCLAFSPDGKKLASGSSDKTAMLWEVATGKEVAACTGPTGCVHALAFSPDGQTLAGGSCDGTASLWDCDTGEVQVTVRGHGRIYAVVWMPDGSRLATAGGDDTVKLWEPRTGQRLALLQIDQRRVSSLAFSPDGKTLAVGGGDDTARLLGTPTDEQINNHPDWARLLWRHAQTFWRQRQFDQAEALFRQALARHRQVFGDDHVLTGQVMMDLALPLLEHGDAADRLEAEALLAGALEIFDRKKLAHSSHLRRLAGRRLLDLLGLVEQGHAHARQGHWKQAAAQFARVVEIDPGEYRHWQVLAVLQLQTGDHDAYRETCRKAFKELSYGSALAQQSLAITCSLAPDATEDPEQIVRVAEAALAKDDKIQMKLVKGMSEYRCGRFEQAIAELPEIGDVRQVPTSLLFRAMAHHRLGQSVQARNFLQRGIQEIEQRIPTIEGPLLAHYIPERWVIWCTLDIVRREAQATVSGPDYELLDKAHELAEAGNLSQAITELSQLQHDDPQLLAERGLLCARLGQWKEAAADYTKLVELKPTERIDWLRAAPLPILAGDIERYREHCQAMLHQFDADNEVSDGREAMIIKACLLVPGVVDSSTFPIETLVKALDDGLVPSARSKWTYTVLALNAYRTAEADKTVHWIHKSQRSHGYAEEPRVQVVALLLLAMAQHQLGQTEEASQAFAEASALVEEHLPKLATGELGGGWHDWLIAEILRREAAKLIAGLTEHPSPEANSATPERRTGAR